MKEWFKQKPLIIAGLVLLVAVAAYMNLRGLFQADVTAGASLAPDVVAVRTTKPTTTPSGKPTATPASTPQATQSGSKFSQLRAERTASREELIAQLDALITRTGTDKDVRKQAEQDKLSLIKWMDAEAAIEAALKAMEYQNAMVTVRDGSVNVVVQAASVDQEAATRIIDLCVRETGLPAKEIKIIIAK